MREKPLSIFHCPSSIFSFDSFDSAQDKLARDEHFPLFMRRTKNGFTLVEMLVVLLIIGIMVGGGVAAYRRLQLTKLVEGEARKAEQGIRSAQKNATAGVKPVSPGWCDDPSDTLVSYTIDFREPPESNFRIFANCSDGAALLLETRTLPAGLRYQWNSSVSFQVMTGRKTTSGDYTQRVRTQNNSIKYKIVVSEGGAVSTERL